MNDPSDIIFCFTLESQLFAIPLASVGQVLLSMAVRPVPNAPPILCGLIDYHGIILPVISLRYRLKMAMQPIRVSDFFIIAQTSTRKIAVVADDVNGVIVPDAKDLVSSHSLDPGIEASGILRRDDGIILIYDLENFLSGQEELEIQAAIDHQTNDNE